MFCPISKTECNPQCALSLPDDVDNMSMINPVSCSIVAIAMALSNLSFTVEDIKDNL